MVKSFTNKDSYQLAQEWFKKAQADIDFARLGLRETEHYGQVCFLAQQADEKYLTCKILDRYYIPARYPVPVEIHYHKQDAKEAIEIAASLMELVLSLLENGNKLLSEPTNKRLNG